MKLGLDQAILANVNDKFGDGVDDGGRKGSRSGEKSKLNSEEIEGLLKYGAYDLFNDKADEASRNFCEDDIDQILKKRSTVLRTGGSSDDHTPSSFSAV